MKPTHHPPEAWLAAYAAGSLDPLRECFVATHVVFCPHCRRDIAWHEDAAAHLHFADPPVSSADDTHLLQTLLAALDYGTPKPSNHAPAPSPEVKLASGEVVQVPQTLSHVVESHVPWRTLSPGWHLKRFAQPVDAEMPLGLLELDPGAQIPVHRHQDREYILVLSGSLDDHHRQRHYQRGDFFECTADDEHALRISGNDPCLCLYALRGRLEFS